MARKEKRLESKRRGRDSHTKRAQERRRYGYTHETQRRKKYTEEGLRRIESDPRSFLLKTTFSYMILAD